MKLTPEHFRALQVLAEAERGLTDALLIGVHGFTIETLVDLVRGKYVTAALEAIKAAGKRMEITRVQITPAGRRALTS